jgi:DNA-binding response OmpR family regulator
MGQESKILIIDNGGTPIETLDGLLKDYGFIIRSSDADYGLEDARTFLPDVIIVDVSVTSKNKSLCAELRLNEDTKDIPILVLCTDEEPMRMRSATDAVSYVMDPFAMMHLFKEMNSNFLLSVN